jgi:hypothetical protein
MALDIIQAIDDAKPTKHGAVVTCNQFGDYGSLPALSGVIPVGNPIPPASVESKYTDRWDNRSYY